MSTSFARYEDRWGPLRAVLFRLIIPAGLLGSILLLLIASMLFDVMAVVIVAYPIVVLLIAFCSVRSALLVRGAARLFAAVMGAVITGIAAALAFGLFIASGGV
jgi:hypothetical protein